MLIIPAIDIKDGQCVRLYQGEMDKETVYFTKPLDAAKHWAEQGAEWLHVVDLNGAVEGRPVHRRQVAAICNAVTVPVQFGGGLRSLSALEEAFGLGVTRVILGTAAYENPDFLRAACRKFSGKIVVGIDARDGRVAVKGWKENTSMDAGELALRCEADGASRIIYTDISRDGTRQGVNVDATRRVALAVKIPVIASGGVATLEDIRRLKEIGQDGVEGVIVGRAIYSGAFTLRDAMDVG
ncbi:MAG TPA: 1-(5-phosphoribosyl)-5-[(5-phosphoribosylamino)methylideneamino]imidazole-4-carboxamide isomerase [Candidatus Binatia bacterium]|jgi:phosphoribosylformimino-5-aminoimidazole carboxamide ribotide isomerase